MLDPAPEPSLDLPPLRQAQGRPEHSRGTPEGGHAGNDNDAGSHVSPISPAASGFSRKEVVNLHRRTLPVERIGALIEVFLCSGFPTQLLVFAALTQLGLSSKSADGSLAPTFIIVWALTDMVLILGLVYMFLRAHGEGVRGFVLGEQRASTEVTLGVMLIPVAFAVVIIVLAVVLLLRPSLNNVPVNPFERMMQTPRDAAIFALVVMLAGGVREEVQRGFIIRRFDQYLGGGILGIAIYSVIFGLGHIEQGYAASIATGSLGALWGFVYYTRRSIVAPMISHAGFNLGQLVKYVTLAAR